MFPGRLRAHPGRCALPRFDFRRASRLSILARPLANMLTAFPLSAPAVWTCRAAVMKPRRSGGGSEANCRSMAARSTRASEAFPLLIAAPPASAVAAAAYWPAAPTGNPPTSPASDHPRRGRVSCWLKLPKTGSRA
jgi:hypothetical protein